jgi:2-octaprenyl-6-methoxyphenol hydroxylase
MLKLDDARLAGEIARRIGNHLGAVHVVGRRWSYPLSAMHAHRYADTRLALVGDAAHTIHPIAGQGLNLGFRDAIALSGLLIEASRRGEDLGAPSLLRQYQRRRRPDNLLMLAATDALDRLFSTDNPLLRLARDVGIAAVHRAPPLKRLFMRQAMGLSLRSSGADGRQEVVDIAP